MPVALHPPVCSDAKAAGAEKVHTKYLFNTCRNHFIACYKVPRDTVGLKCYQSLVWLMGTGLCWEGEPGYTVKNV
jgi:hypothetical protein